MFTGSSIKCVPCSHMEWSSVCGGVCIRNRHSKHSQIFSMTFYSLLVKWMRLSCLWL